MEIFRPADVIVFMVLLLWSRSDAEDGLPVAARPLTGHGRAQAERMARWLAPRLPRNLRMIVSPARRAQETARALHRSFETSDALAPGVDAKSLVAAAGWPDSDRPVLLVGHQPTLGEVASKLIEGHKLPWRIGKGALWWLRSKRGKNRGAVLLLALEPEILEREGK